jgi:hypothetical protein
MMNTGRSPVVARRAFSSTTMRLMRSSTSGRMVVPVGLSGELSAINRACGRTAAICSGVGWNWCSRVTSSGTPLAPVM